MYHYEMKENNDFNGIKFEKMLKHDLEFGDLLGG